MKSIEKESLAMAIGIDDIIQTLDYDNTLCYQNVIYVIDEFITVLDSCLRTIYLEHIFDYLYKWNAGCSDIIETIMEIDVRVPWGGVNTC
jgi:hypothetical protein